MNPDIDALKQRFRQGQHAQAIAQCEALCLQHPARHEIKRLCATMQALVHNYGRALELLYQIRNPQAEDADILFNIGVCERELGDFEAGAQIFRLFTEKFADKPDGWASLAECMFQLQRFEEGIRLADRAIEIDPAMPSAWTVRGNLPEIAAAIRGGPGELREGQPDRTRRRVLLQCRPDLR